ncbi:magnesium chelatase subunit D [Melghirimyces profundicolus]|uniref:Mg-protoporphyrin IX chelatase n=1 Tax=Melghirimyces profundicolus TaxID=1242148 RepID=A0A2T6C8C3_9BACL|nr:VWA domain-containing protein [Melghirimyces profundicolus]PTX64564.1 magnesium chelatase subunit D [Melghirimyces profundicolus]
MHESGYPFTAMVGQEDLKTALLLNAVSHRVGGVLIRGEKGNGKTTAVRALAELLPPIPVVPGCSLGCDPNEPFTFCPHCEGVASGEPPRHRKPTVAELPLGAMEDRLLGHPDLEAMMKRGEKRFRPGLLARAHRGILYVDEVNLLEDHLVDLLLDAAASGRNRVEREGFSVVHPARFILAGTMNPEEGDLRPQLLDRFGLSVEVKTPSDPHLRLEVMERRMAFEQDPEGFRAAWADAQKEEAERLREARERLNRVTMPRERLEQVVRICTEALTEGVRADLVICEAAKARAAYCGRDAVSAGDVNLAARLALSHRAQQPWQPDPGPSGGDFPDPPSGKTGGGEEKLQESPGDSEARQTPLNAEAPSVPDGAGSEGEAVPGAAAAPEERPEGSASRESPEAFTDAAGSQVKESLFPVGSWFRISPDDREASPRRRSSSGPPLSPSRTRRAGRREHPFRGRCLKNRPSPSLQGARSFDWEGSLIAACGKRGGTGEIPPFRLLRREDLREKVFVQPDRNRVLFLVDASGSMAGYGRMEQVKGALRSWMEACYRRREDVALLSFRNGEVTRWLSPTRSVQAATQALAQLPSGGGTPLAEALEQSYQRIGQWDTRGGESRLVVVTDGRLNLSSRENGSLDEAFRRVREVAGKIREAGISCTVVDTETGPLRLGWCRRLARELKGDYLHLDHLRDPDDGGLFRGIG